MISINGSAVVQSAVSLVAGLTFLEAMREIPSMYSEKQISDAQIAKMVMAVIILTFVMFLIWQFGAHHASAPAQEDHSQPAAQVHR